MAHIYTNQRVLSRRFFLRGVGATMALPLLEVMLPRYARAAEPMSKPRRSVFVYIPNGVNGMTWQVTKSGREFALSPDESTGSVFGIVRNPYDLDHTTAGYLIAASPSALLPLLQTVVTCIGLHMHRTASTDKSD